MHHVFKRTKDNKYPIAILIKESAFDINNISKHYVNDLTVGKTGIIAFGLKYNSSNKAPVKLQKEYLANLLPDLKTTGVLTVLCADANYFKTLTGLRKAEPHHGYIKPCVIKGYEFLNIILAPNYQALFHNPAIKDKVTLAIKTFNNHFNGIHVDIGANVIAQAEYPVSEREIKHWLNKLLKVPKLAVDIETFSLKFWEAGIGSIGFAWNENNGISFLVDYSPMDSSMKVLGGNGRIYGAKNNNKEIKKCLREFFEAYEGELTYHNGTFDIKVMIYELFMENMLDYEGLYYGLKVMCKNIQDSKLIAYLATNTTAGNDLRLKALAFEHAGNYAQDDIEDIRLIEPGQLLKYNLIDCLCTNYVKNRYYPIMVKDQQLDLYNDMFIPGTKMIVHTELTGMPMNMDKVTHLENNLHGELLKYTDILNDSPIVKRFEWEAQRIAMIDANLLLKKKVRPLEDFYAPFNPNSGPQTAKLVHDTMGFDVIDKTDTGLPATGAKTLKKHLTKLMKEYNLTEEDLK